MKKIFIVLLIAAIGVGVYFYLSQKQNVSTPNSTELIIGKWKVDSLVTPNPADSSLKTRTGWIHAFFDTSLDKYDFEFRKDSLIIQTQDQKIQDTSHYEFTDDKDLLIWSNGDTVKTKWNIDKLDSTAMVVKDKDSSVFYFRRIKDK
ncbi:MAG: hypothetical protein ACHQF0_13260 [Chitinophagales bacterium]